MRLLLAVRNFVDLVLMILGGVAVLGLMGVATANVVLRFLKVPWAGAPEMVGFLGAVVIAFALGYTQRRKDHIVVDIVSNKFPAWLARPIDIVRYIAEMVFFGIISRQLFVLAFRYREMGEVSETLQIVFYPFVICVAAGFAALALNLLVDLLMRFRTREPAT